MATNNMHSDDTQPTNAINHSINHTAELATATDGLDVGDRNSKNKPSTQNKSTDDRTSPNAVEDITEMTKRAAKQHKKWNRRLKIFFCCLGYKKNKDSIADVASIFAEFYADLNVPSSDIAAGFVLLSKYQAAQREWIIENGHLGIEQYFSCVPIKRDTQYLDISTAEDSHLINDLIYYMNYSLAIFGWPLQVVDDPCMLCCIYPYLKLTPCSSNGGGGGGGLNSGSNGNGRGDGKEKTKRQTKKRALKDKTDPNLLANNNNESDKADEQADRGTIAPPPTLSDAAVKTSDDPNNNNTTSLLTSDTNDIDPSDGNINYRGSLRRSTVGELDDDCDLPIILDDNCCSCNSASAERRLAAHNYEIIYVNYRVKINVIPFLVAADHSKQTIVVALRGSMSLSDMVTDMNGTVDKVPIENCPDDWLCHRGITRAASYVKSTLEEERILARAFSCRPDLGSQDYTLVLCGHSLGAGAAAILGVLMRPQYPNLKAYLYSPPGGILSMPVVEYTKQFAVGIILGNDTVPRLGMAQLERLRYHTLLSLKSSQKSASKILVKALCPSFCFGSNKVDYDPGQSLDLLYGTEARSFDYSGTKIPFQVQPQVLYVPGRLIHVVKNHSFKTKTRRLFNEPIYQAVWTNNEDYDRIMIGEGMLFDHLPNHLMHAMKMLFCKTLPGRRESKSSSTGVTADRISTVPNGSSEHGLDHPANDGMPRLKADERILATHTIKSKDLDDLNNNNNNNDEEVDNYNNNQDKILYPNLIRHESQNKTTTSDDASLRHDICLVGSKGDLDENGNEKI